MIPARILVVAACGLAVLQAQGQQPTFRARIDLIQVNVVAVDQSGKHVYGLTATDFTLLDRGRKQEIATFQEIGSGPRAVAETASRQPVTARRDVSSNQVAESDRLVVLVIDDLHIFKGRTDKAKAVARDAVLKLATGAFMAVLFTSGERSTEITDDASRLMAAVETFNGRQGWRRPHQADDAQTPPRIDPEMDPLLALDTVNRSQGKRVNEFFDNMAQFKTLEDAARMLRLSPARRKAFVLVSEGIDLNPTGVFDEPLPEIFAYHGRALQDMMRSMRRSNVATYVLDPRGHVTTQQLALENHPSPPGLLGTAGGTPADEDQPFRWANPVRRAQDGMQLIAEASGGFAVTNDDDLAGGLSRIIEDLDHYYLLGFYPADPDGPPYRPLEVTASRPGLTLRFRRAYAEVGAPDAPKKGIDPLASLVTAALPSSDVPMRLNAIQMPGLAKETRIAFALELSAPPDGGAARADRRLDDIRYGLFVFDLKSGKAVRQFSNTAQILFKNEAPADRPKEAIRYQIMTALALPPGEYQVRASATSDTLGAGGSVFLPLSVADSSRRTWDVSDLALGYVTGPRTAVARDKTLSAADAIRLPLEPTLDRAFSTTDDVRICASVVRRQPVDLKATVSVRSADGKAAFDESLALPAGEDVIDTVLPLARLAPGAYVLRVAVTGGAGRVERELAFAVR